MKKGLWITIGVLVLVAASYPAGAWYSGIVVQSRLKEYRQLMLKQAPYLTVAQEKYARGIYRSHEEITYEVGKRFLGELAKATAPSGAAGKLPESLSFTVRSEVEHGPFPKMGPLALARVETEFVLSDPIRKELAKVFGAGKPIEIVTLLSYGGGGSTTISSPSFEGLKLEDATMSWRGFKATVDFGPQLSTIEMQGAAPGFEVTSEKSGSAKLDDVSFESKSALAFDDLYLGDASIKVKGLNVQPSANASAEAKPAAAMAMSGLAYTARMARKDDFLDLSGKFVVGNMDVSVVKLSDLHYEFSLNHLHGPSVAAFVRLVRKSFADGRGTLAGELPTEGRRIGIEILKRDPELVIDQISFTMPEGDAKLTGRMHIAGFDPSDIDGPSGPVVLLRKIDAEVDFSMSEALFAKFAASAGGGSGAATAEQNLAAMEAQGYVTRKDGRLTTHIEYKGGQLTVNGKPFVPPTPNATQMPPGTGKPARDTTHT
jgi:uncharacterized protein YdgA (DUF945 family)